MTPDVISQSVQLWSKDAAKAKISPVVKARTDGAQAVLDAGAFTWRMDLPPALGGDNKAASPTALLLGALAGCAALFIRDTLAPQLGVRVESVQAEASCQADLRGLVGMPGAVPDLTDLKLLVTIKSPDGKDKIAALEQAWLARCPVYLALTKPTNVATTFAASA